MDYNPHISFLDSVTDLALCIEQCFVGNPHCKQIEKDKDVYFWYNKCGGDNSGLNVKILLKDSKGREVNNLSSPIPLRTEMVYDDGSSCPLMPLSPLKERRSVKLSSKPLYRRLYPDPTLCPQVTQAQFSFRIEEVSFHHSGHKGFKLKVSTADNGQNIHPGILEETIVVLSKPRPCMKSSKQKSSPNYYDDNKSLKTDQYDVTKLNRRHNRGPRKVSEENTSTSLMVSIPVCTVFQIFQKQHACVLCGRFIKKENFLKCSDHEPDCKFVRNIYPLITNIGLSESDSQCSRLKTKKSKRISSNLKERTIMNNTYHQTTVFPSNITLSPVTSAYVRIKTEYDSRPRPHDTDSLIKGDIIHCQGGDSNLTNKKFSTKNPFQDDKDQMRSHSEINQLEELDHIPLKIEPLSLNETIKSHQSMMWDEFENRSLLDFLMQGNLHQISTLPKSEE